MQQKADVFEQVEGPRGGRALVNLLLVFGLMRVDSFKDAQSPENHRAIRVIYMSSLIEVGSVLYKVQKKKSYISKSLDLLKSLYIYKYNCR